MRRVAPTHSAGSSSRRPRIRRGSDLVERVISNLDRLTRDLDAADRAASVGGREAAHGHVASLRPYRLSAGSRCAEQPKPARQRDPARMVRAKILAPHRGARRARASPGRRRSAWRALAIDRHALAFGPGHGAGGLDHVGDVVWPFGVGESVASKVGAQHAPSPRLRGRHGRLGGDGAAWAAQEESRAQQRVDRTAPGLPGRHVVTGSSRSRSGNSPRVVSTIPRRSAALVFAASGHGPCVTLLPYETAPEA